MRRGPLRCTHLVAARRIPGWAALCLAVLALVASPAAAQVLRLTPAAAWPATAHLGDTLDVGLHVSAGVIYLLVVAFNGALEQATNVGNITQERRFGGGDVLVRLENATILY